MLNDREDEMRKRALELAVGTSGSSMIGGPPPEQVVARAEAYFAFLNGGTKDEADHG